MNRFIEVVRSLKGRSESTAACPRCGSLDVRKSSGMDGWLMPPLYLCNRCGYAGRLVLEVKLPDAVHEASDNQEQAA